VRTQPIRTTTKSGAMAQPFGWRRSRRPPSLPQPSPERGHG
jgi:hypothetical protein